MPIRNLQHFGMTVPDLEVGRRFYTDFGLTAEEQGNRLVLRCDGREQDQIVLMEGTPKRLHHVCFGATDDDLPELQANIEAAGVTLIDPPKEAEEDGDGLWFRDFDDMLFRIKVADEADWDRSPPAPANSPIDRVRQGGRSALCDETPIKPRRLGHIVVFASDLPRKTAFFEDVLGSRVSDQVEHFLVFHHLPTGSDHHVIAFGKSHAQGLQHAGFEVSNADEVGIGARQMIDKGYVDCWGPGRHAPGSNLFHYLRDPWSSIVEYFADMDYIPANIRWEAKHWEDKNATSLWGDTEPRDFPVNFEAINTTTPRL